MSFCENLRSLRQQAGISRTDIAEHLHMHPNAYGSYENGNREPSLGKLVAIAQYLGTTPNALLGYNLPSVDEANRIIVDCDLLINTDDEGRIGVSDSGVYTLKWYDTPEAFAKEIMAIHKDFLDSNLRIEAEQSYLLSKILNPYLHKKRKLKLPKGRPLVEEHGMIGKALRSVASELESSE